MSTEQLIKQYQLTVTKYEDGWTVNDPFSGPINGFWPLITGRPTKAKAVGDAVAYLKRAEKLYRHCAECGKRLTDEEYAYNRKKMAGSNCSNDCTRKQIVRSHACCERATLYPCVCTYSFTCPKHGVMHIGTHD